MRENAIAVAERWRGRLGERLALHMGINTGPVVAGDQGGGGRQSYSITGDTVNTAARLQTMAAPDEILVGPTTHGLTRHVFAFEPIGELRLRGKAETLRAYRLLGVLAGDRQVRGLAPFGHAAPLIGREVEHAQLLAAYDRAAAGHMQLVRVVAEAGSGKSRLVDEFLRRVAKPNGGAVPSVRRAMCSALGERTYRVIATILRDAYGIAAADGVDAIDAKLTAGLDALGASEAVRAELLPLLRHTLGGARQTPPAMQLEPEQFRRQLFLAFRTVGDFA